MKLFKRVLFALTVALTFGLPLLFEHVADWGFAVPFLVLLNLPGMLFGFVNGGRFFPPEGHPGQSPIHFTLMILGQSVLVFGDQPGRSCPREDTKTKGRLCHAV
jgi:hypothetical protein